MARFNIYEFLEKGFKDLKKATEERKDISFNDGRRETILTTVYIVPNPTEPLMAQTNEIWTHYFNLLARTEIIQKLNYDFTIKHDVNSLPPLRILHDLQDQMEHYKQQFDVTGMEHITCLTFMILSKLEGKVKKHIDDFIPVPGNIDPLSIELLRKHGLLVETGEPPPKRNPVFSIFTK